MERARKVLAAEAEVAWEDGFPAGSWGRCLGAAIDGAAAIWSGAHCRLGGHRLLATHAASAAEQGAADYQSGVKGALACLRPCRLRAHAAVRRLRGLWRVDRWRAGRRWWSWGLSWIRSSLAEGLLHRPLLVGRRCANCRLASAAQAEGGERSAAVTWSSTLAWRLLGGRAVMARRRGRRTHAAFWRRLLPRPFCSSRGQCRRFARSA